jgi:hypothetical protein
MISAAPKGWGCGGNNRYRLAAKQRSYRCRSTGSPDMNPITWGESLYQSLCVSMDKRVSVPKFEIGYGVRIAHIERIIKDPTSRKQSFYVRVLIEHEW